MFPLINKRETGVNLRRIMDMRGFTPKDVQEYLGLGCVQSVYRWTDGVNMPTIDNLYALTVLQNVSIYSKTSRYLGFDEASEEINRIAKEKKEQPTMKDEKLTELKVVQCLANMLGAKHIYLHPVLHLLLDTIW